MGTYRILAINPGSTSTKVALFKGREPVSEFTLRHSAEELKDFPNIIDQFDFRKNLIVETLQAAGVDMYGIDAVIGRGGLVKPISSGIYEVNEALKHDLLNPSKEHASNLGGLIADYIAGKIGVKAYIADPVVVDELQDIARLTGIPEIPRISIFHALNHKAMARLLAERKGVTYESMRLIVAHLGGGISVGAHLNGQVIDVPNCLDGEGPIMPERAGTIPAGQLAELCYSGKYTWCQMKKKITGAGGMVAHLGTNNMMEVEKMVEAGDEKARLLRDAMGYTVAKHIGAMAAVLDGEVDYVILTGGIAHDKYLCEYITRKVKFIAPVEVLAGENELEALAMNVLRVLEGRQTPKVYV